MLFPLLLLLLHLTVDGASALRCYVCGGHSRRPCTDIRQSGRRSPYVRPSPVPAADGSKQWEECTDLISNKGCIKQVVNNVVLLRACWMQATDQCLVDGEAAVCTCTQDLCNVGSTPRSTDVVVVVLLLFWTCMQWAIPVT